MKICKECGCIMPDDHESDLCECCQDDRLVINHKDESSIYPVKMVTFGYMPRSMSQRG